MKITALLFTTVSFAKALSVLIGVVFAHLGTVIAHGVSRVSAFLAQDVVLARLGVAK